MTPPCKTCNGTGQVKALEGELVRFCPACSPRLEVDKLQLSAMPPANRAGLTRKTLQGMCNGIIDAVQRVAYAGEEKPYVFLYVRPGSLPSVKVTVELHTIADAQVVFEKELD